MTAKWAPTEEGLVLGSPCAKTLNALRDRIAVSMGGREAETLVHGDVTAGSGASAQSDRGIATDLAARLLFQLGVAGNLARIPDRATSAILCPPPRDRRRIKDLLQAETARAREIVAERREEVIDMSQQFLEEREVIFDFETKTSPQPET